MSTFLSEGDSHNILIGVISSAVFAFLQWLVIRALQRIAKFPYGSSLYWNRFHIIGLSSFWVLFNAFYIYFKLPYSEFFALITFFLFVYSLWQQLNQFSEAGFIRLDSTVATGLDYEASLKLCRNQLEFLGIGAAKLTAAKEFESAIERCNRPNVPIRFLLTRPNNPLLERAAKQSGIDPNKYKQNVESSLKILAGLKKNRGMNIEVRFYPNEKGRDFPLFRLMFIDDSLCLLSYNVFGEGDGSQLPQLHLKKFKNRRDVESFYYPFKAYYDQLWEDSSPWDFEPPVK